MSYPAANAIQAQTTALVKAIQEQTNALVEVQETANLIAFLEWSSNKDSMVPYADQLNIAQVVKMRLSK